MAAFPYQLYGGATREDAISGLDRRFIDALTQLYTAAPPEVQRELGLNSAYRSAAIQQELWDKSDKTGRTVARPGKSKHQHGTAADLYGFGLTDDQVSPATREWVAANAANYGLYFPMDYEPWHIQLRDRHAGTLPGEGPGSFDYDLAPPVSPLGDTLAGALSQQETPLQKLAGMASGISKSLLNKGDAGELPLGSDPGGPLQPVSLETPSAQVPSGYLETPSTVGDLTVQPGPGAGLADLFKIKTIGTSPIRPGGRF